MGVPVGALITAAVIFTIASGMFRNQNQNRRNPNGGSGGRSYRRNQRRETRRTRRDYQRPTTQTSPLPRATRRPQSTIPKKNPFKASGLKKFKEFEYEGAIEDFEKALQIDNNDIATHFNIACAYSLMENKDKAFYHLDKAVQLGFKDTARIKNHDALAYIRIQDEFEAFESNGYRLGGQSPLKKDEELLTNNPDLLEQLKQLGELREKGLLTNAEFEIQKKKLLG